MKGDIKWKHGWQLDLRSLRDGIGESHPCAKSAQEWGTLCGGGGSVGAPVRYGAPRPTDGPWNSKTPPCLSKERRDKDGATSRTISGLGDCRASVCAFEEAGGYGAEDEAAYVGEVGYSSGLGVGYLAGVEELGQEPEAD